MPITPFQQAALDQLSQQFLQPFIVPASGYNVDTSQGVTLVPLEYVGTIDLEADEPDYSALMAYLETTDSEDIESVEFVSGFQAYLAAPGYMDQSDIGIFDTYEKAVAAILEFASDDFALEDTDNTSELEN